MTANGGPVRPDPQRDPFSYSFDELKEMSSEDRLAIMGERQRLSEVEATARRGGPLDPSTISRVKGDVPVVTRVVRPAPEGRDR